MNEKEQIIAIINANQKVIIDDLEASKTVAAEHLPFVEEIQKRQMELLKDLEALRDE